VPDDCLAMPFDKRRCSALRRPPAKRKLRAREPKPSATTTWGRVTSACRRKKEGGGSKQAWLPKSTGERAIPPVAGGQMRIGGPDGFVQSCPSLPGAPPFARRPPPPLAPTLSQAPCSSHIATRIRRRPATYNLPLRNRRAARRAPRSQRRPARGARGAPARGSLALEHLAAQVHAPRAHEAAPRAVAVQLAGGEGEVACAAPPRGAGGRGRAAVGAAISERGRGRGRAAAAGQRERRKTSGAARAVVTAGLRARGDAPRLGFAPHGKHESRQGRGAPA
jgi:hypothetical protein